MYIRSTDTVPINLVMWSKRTRKPQYVLDYLKADFNGLSDYLLQVDFSDCYHSDDVEYVWAIIKQSILLLYIPKVRLKSQQTPKWNPTSPEVCFYFEKKI